MIVKLQFESDDGDMYNINAKESSIRGPLGDKIIREIDRVMKGASWKRSGNGWIASQ